MEPTGLEKGPYPDLVQLNTRRVVLDSVGRPQLERTVADYLASLQTAMTVFEANGEYATGDRPRGWCGFIDELSRPKGEENAADGIAAGRWACREGCRRPALEAMQTGASADFACLGGLRVHAAPILVGGKVVGSISVGCGRPALGDAELDALSDRFGASVEQLRREADAFSRGSAESEELACHAVDATARLMGEMIARRNVDVDRERAREMYTGMIAHDLRSPLAAISLGVDLLLHSAGASASETGKVERIGRSAQRMTRMVEDLLDLTRARLGGGIPLRLQRHSLALLVAEMIEFARLANPQHVLRLISEGDTSLECDAGRLREVIENLLGNAIRHGAGSPIGVEVSGLPHEVVLRIHNGGPPISASLLPSIFDPFEQARLLPSAGRSTGLGLGLHIAHEFVRAHGGTIDVVSSAETGTRFSVRLPRAQPVRT